MGLSVLCKVGTKLILRKMDKIIIIYYIYNYIYNY
jgi:hypothetical protein